MGPIKFTVIKNLKTNNRFNYTPRYYKGKEAAEEHKHPTKFDAYSDTYNDNDYSGHWQNARTATRNRNNGEFNKTVLVVIAILILIFLFFIDFDVSIFSA